MTLSPSKIFAKTIHFDLVLNNFEKYGKEMRWPSSSKLKMVDVGTGPGQIVLEVEKKLPKDYTEILCLDKQKEMVEYFNSVQKDPRFKCALFDIEKMNVPEDKKGVFDLVFSSLCFSFVRDFRQVFRNCNHFLKPGGECFLIWAKKAHFYDTYKELSATKQWGKYTKDFKDWKQYFSADNSSELLPPFLEKFGLEILNCDDLNDTFFEYEDVEDVLEIFTWLDAVSLRIPKCDLQMYKEDFKRVARKFIMIDEENPNGMKAKQHFPTLVVAARKFESV